MCEALFWVWNLRSEDFFGVWNFVVTFFGWEILVRTFWGVDKKRNPGFSFFCQTTVSWRKKCLEFSWIIIYYYYYYLIGLFLGYVLGHWTFFGSGSSLKDFFWVKQFRLIRTSPSLIYLSTPPPPPGQLTLMGFPLIIDRNSVWILCHIQNQRCT